MKMLMQFHWTFPKYANMENNLKEIYTYTYKLLCCTLKTNMIANQLYFNKKRKYVGIRTVLE